MNEHVNVYERRITKNSWPYDDITYVSVKQKNSIYRVYRFYYMHCGDMAGVNTGYFMLVC